MRSGGGQLLQENNDYFQKMFDNQTFIEYTLTIKVKGACFERSKNQ